MEGRFSEAAQQAWLALDSGGRAGEVDAEQFLVLQLGIIRMLQGEFDEAEVRAAADRYPRVPAWRCGLAHLLAQQGRMAEARHELATVSASGFASQRNVHWLAGMSLLAAASTSLGDTERAAVLYEQLAPYASLVVVVGGAFACLGSVSHYLGGLAATLGRLEQAIRHYQDALTVHHRMGARPWVATTELAWARMLLAHGAPGDRPRADELLADARRTAEEIDMRDPPGGLRALAAEAGGSPPAGSNRVVANSPPPAGSTEIVRARLPEEPSIFRHDGGFWTIAFGGQTLRLRDSKGLHYLARLLRDPWREFHALDLVAVADTATGSAGDRAGPGGNGVLHARAKDIYRDRLSELRDELAEAERWNDPERATRVREEIDALGSELAATIGIGEHAGPSPSPAERARVNVTKRVLAAVRTIAAHHPALGRHLHSTIRTGTFFSYTPDTRVPVCWTE
jgi:tetratricopeptide (TPR) repeat protein